MNDMESFLIRKNLSMSIPPYVRKAVTSVFLASLAFSLTPAVAHADPAGNNPVLPPSPVQPTLPKDKQRYIVKYANDVNPQAKSDSLKKKGMEVKETLSHVMKASVVVATQAEIETLKNSKDVASVEIDQPVSISGVTSLWGLDRVDQRTGRDGQYSIGDEGAGVNVYVVDTGLHPSHTEFSGRALPGWNGINDSNGTNDCNGHGTHVAGTVAGTTYGVAKKASIIPIRALDCNGSGWSSTAIAGIDWAISHHVAGQPAVMNMSIGGFVSTSFDQAVDKAVADGITVVAAAGNSNKDACEASPAKVPSAITVAATDVNDAQASFSNYGSCVDVQAPGVSIKSAHHTSTTAAATYSGTSMAAPHVAGAAAILLSRNRALTPAQVHQAVISDSTTGIITSNKGTTPNRLLFIPAAPAPVSTSVTSKTLEAVDSSGVLWAYSTPGNATIGSRVSLANGWGNAKQLIKTDWNSDGILDIVARWSNGTVTMYAGTGTTSYRAPITIGSGGWQNFDINAVKLKKTDKYPGLVARDVVNGTLYYYPNTTGGAMATSRILIGSGGWASMTEISALQWDADGNMDLIARNSAGELKLYRTNGAGAFINEARLTIGTGWKSMNHVAVQHGFAGAGTVGIIARNTNGALLYYPISSGKIQAAKTIGSGWTGYNIAAGTP